MHFGRSKRLGGAASQPTKEATRNVRDGGVTDIVGLMSVLRSQRAHVHTKGDAPGLPQSALLGTWIGLHEAEDVGIGVLHVG